MNTERLRNVANLLRWLDQAPREPGAESVDDHFDMSVWRTKLSGHGRCNTAACAIGWYTKLQDVPLKLRHRPDPIWGGIMLPRFDGAWGFVALACYFDISADDAQRLFDCGGYVDLLPSLAVVAERIEHYIAPYSKPEVAR
jgi:hypothetical protein